MALIGAQIFNKKSVFSTSQLNKGDKQILAQTSLGDVDVTITEKVSQ